MQKLMREYLNELKNRKKRRRRTQIAVVILVSIVVGSVIGALAQYGVAMTGREKCGKEEHQHDLDCYEKTLVCTQPESDGHHHTDACYRTETHLVCGLEESEEHTHSDDCYETTESLICGEEEYEGHHHTDACYEDQLVCGKEVHTHSEECYIDTEADVEDANLWNKQYEDLKWKDTWSENLVMAAREQIGYKESADNYTIAEDGSHKGYTRYGQFAVDTGVEGADVYADWDTAFVNFCLFYSGISATNIFPTKMDTVEWYEEFRKINENIDEYLSCLIAPEGYTPKAGDIVIFQKGKEEEEREYQMGIVSSYDKEKDELKVIEGNSKNEVKENDYYIEAKGDQDDGMAPVFCYVDMSGIEKAYKGTDEAEEDPVEPGEPVEPEEPKDDKTETEEPKDTADTEEPDEKTDEEENPEEETIELTTKVDGTTITLSGPASSFEEGKKYEIQAEKVEDEEVLATVEEAVEQMAEEQEKKVENFQPYDIKLLSDGEEVQPLGPVAVKFSGKEVAKSVENEETEVNVLHVDENTGEATDMEATPTEEKEVVIETDHFSIYVYIEVGVDLLKGVNINIQHWGENIETIDRSATFDNGGITEEAFKKVGDTAEVATKTETCQLYSTDLNYNLPSESFTDIRTLSKVYNADQGKRYEIEKVWISKPGKEKNCKENLANWNKNDYTEYKGATLQSSQENVLTNIKEGSVIRFWYTPPTKKGTVKEEVTFFDYDHSVKNGTKLNTSKQGINADTNYKNNNKPKLGIGQSSAGSASPWINNTYNGKYLNAGNSNAALEGLVTGVTKIGKDGKPVFNTNINVPNNLFSHNPRGGSYQYNDYKLEFSQNGDTYTLINVYNGNQKTNAKDLTTFQSRQNYSKTKYIYSNDFWPLDDATYKRDPLFGSTRYSIDPTVEDTKGNTVSQTIGPNDFEGAHNWYFGMSYTVKFKVGDYTGPLEYYFRGDDDFWLFVDGELKVDLGGIHTALGTTCDLNYLKNQDKDKEHYIQVYYMERGATGSTCYMQFTLPKAEIEPLEPSETTSYTVIKEWDDKNNGFRPQDIEITLYKIKGNEKVAAATKRLPLRDENGNYVDQNGNRVDQPVWTFTWDDLPIKDGWTGEDITYEADEEYIDPSNVDNPMLGYDYERIEEQNGTQITLRNYMKDKKVKVHKTWEDDDKETENRPDEVTFKLYANGSAYKDYEGNYRTVTVSKNTGWEGEFDHVPEYYYKKNELTNEGTWEKVVYSVVEVPSEGNGILTADIGTAFDDKEFTGKNGAKYDIKIVDVTTEEDINAGYIACFEATNTLITKNVSLKKISKSSGEPGVEGAVFNLYKGDPFDPNGELKEDAVVVRSQLVTDKDGLVDIQGLPFDTYYLVEIQPPKGHALLEKPIKLVATKDGVTVDFQIDDWDNADNITLSDGTYVIRIPNEVLYELPSTGGSGIYWYMFSGVLLMAAASLITYRNKRREVLRS